MKAADGLRDLLRGCDRFDTDDEDADQDEANVLSVLADPSSETSPSTKPWTSTRRKMRESTPESAVNTGNVDKLSGIDNLIKKMEVRSVYFAG